MGDQSWWRGARNRFKSPRRVSRPEEGTASSITLKDTMHSARETLSGIIKIRNGNTTTKAVSVGVQVQWIHIAISCMDHTLANRLQLCTNLVSCHHDIARRKLLRADVRAVFNALKRSRNHGKKVTSRQQTMSSNAKSRGMVVPLEISSTGVPQVEVGQSALYSSCPVEFVQNNSHTK